MASQLNSPSGAENSGLLLNLKSTRIYPLLEGRPEDEDSIINRDKNSDQSKKKTLLQQSGIQRDSNENDPKSPQFSEKDKSQKDSNVIPKLVQSINITEQDGLITQELQQKENANERTTWQRKITRKQSMKRNGQSELGIQLPGSFRSTVIMSKKRYSDMNQYGKRQNESSRSRRNGLAPLNQLNKQILGRISYLGMQNSQNQADSDSGSVENEHQLSLSNCSTYMTNKKLSISWRFINILVMIQTLTNKIKILGQKYRLNKLNEFHFSFINDVSQYKNDTHFRGTVKNKLKQMEEWLIDLKIVKTFGQIEVLKPEQRIVIFWKTLIFCMLISQLIYIPIKIAFFDFDPHLSDTNQILLNRLPFAICICDILINFNLAFFSAEGVVVNDRKGIIQNYLQFPFWLDLITTVALSLSGFKYVDLCFLFRIFQISEIISYLDERFQLSQRFNTPFTLIKLIATIIVIAHIFGCGFYFMSLSDPHYNWVKSLEALQEDSSWGTLYIKSLYFIIITMITVGFGDITPKNNYETVYVLGIALLSCFQFGYTVNIIGSLFQEKAQQQAIIKQIFELAYSSIFVSFKKSSEISDINLHALKNDRQSDLLFFILSTAHLIQGNSLQMLVLKNLDYIQNQQIDSPESGLSILAKVSENLRKQVRYDFYWRILKQQPILNHYFSEQFLKALTRVMSERACIPGEFIYTVNQLSTSHSFYILIKGQIDLTLQSLQERESKKKFIVLHKKAGELFGHFTFFTSQPRETDCECSAASHLISCTQADFLTVAKDFPKDYVDYQLILWSQITLFVGEQEKFCYVKDQIMLYQKDKDMKCLACGKFGHFVIDCPFIHLTNYKSLVIGKHNYTEEQRRSEFCERTRRKNTTLSNININRTSLKKIRIKFIEKYERLKEKKMKKNKLSLGLDLKMNEPKQEDIKISKDVISSFESSDLSDYKYELELEEQQRNLKKEQQLSNNWMNSNQDKMFFTRHSRIQLIDKEVITYSLSEDSQCSYPGEQTRNHGLLYHQEDDIEEDYDDQDEDNFDEDQLNVEEKILDEDQSLDDGYNLDSKKETPNAMIQNKLNDPIKKLESNKSTPAQNAINANQNKIHLNRKNTNENFDNLRASQSLNFQLAVQQNDQNNQLNLVNQISQNSDVAFNTNEFNIPKQSTFSAKSLPISPNEKTKVKIRNNSKKSQEKMLERMQSDNQNFSSENNKQQVQFLDEIQQITIQKQYESSNNNNNQSSAQESSKRIEKRISSTFQILATERSTFKSQSYVQSRRSSLNGNDSQRNIKIADETTESEREKDKTSKEADQISQSHAIVLEKREGINEFEKLSEQLESENSDLSILDLKKSSYPSIERDIFSKDNQLQTSDRKEFLSIKDSSQIDSRNKMASYQKKKRFIAQISQKEKPKIQALKSALFNKSFDLQEEQEDNKIENGYPIISIHLNSQQKPKHQKQNFHFVNKSEVFSPKPLDYHTIFQNISTSTQNNHFPNQALGQPLLQKQQQSNNKGKLKKQSTITISSPVTGGIQPIQSQQLQMHDSRNQRKTLTLDQGCQVIQFMEGSSQTQMQQSQQQQQQQQQQGNLQYPLLQQQQQQQQQMQLQQQLIPLPSMQQQQQQQSQKQQQQQQQIQQSQQSQSQSQPIVQVATQQEDEQKKQDDIFEIEQFDKSKHYTVYYPHNNLIHVLESFSKFQLKKMIVSRFNMAALKKPLTGNQQQSSNQGQKMLNISALMKKLLVKH